MSVRSRVWLLLVPIIIAGSLYLGFTRRPVVAMKQGPVGTVPAATAPASAVNLAVAEPTVPAVAHAPAPIPILMYHVIGEGPNNLFVSEADFRQQMAYLDKGGYHAITMQQLYDGLTTGAPLPERPVAITFDDGYESHYTKAFPILKEHHFTGTFYVVTGLLGRQGYLSPEQTIAMDRDGMEMDAHTRHHLDLSTLSGQRLIDEVAGSKRDLEQVLGHVVAGFCYPAGRFNREVEGAVQNAGYRHATTTQSGLATTTNDLFRLPRVRVSRGESLSAFVRAIEPNG